MPPRDLCVSAAQGAGEGCGETRGAHAGGTANTEQCSDSPNADRHEVRATPPSVGSPERNEGGEVGRQGGDSGGSSLGAPWITGRWRICGQCGHLQETGGEDWGGESTRVQRAGVRRAGAGGAEPRLAEPSVRTARGEGCPSCPAPQALAMVPITPACFNGRLSKRNGGRRQEAAHSTICK